ncbi:MAG: alginate export family protein [Gammaproteobacteria bacterium]
MFSQSAIKPSVYRRLRYGTAACALLPLFPSAASADPYPPAYSAAVLSPTYKPAPIAPSYSFDKPIENALKFGHYGKYGQIKFDLRYRYEHVDDEMQLSPKGQPLKNANANTLRLRAGYLTPEFHGFQGYAEYQGLAAMQEDYNSTRNGLTQYSTVVDPDKSELNQLWISYKGIPDTNIIGGRQRITLDDHRFIGNVGWRQLEQTYDGALVVNKSIPNLTATVGYLGNVQTVNATTDVLTTPFVNLNYALGDYGNMVGYAYWLDYDDPAKYARSSQSYGLRFAGSKNIDENFGVMYTAEWSTQSDYRHNPNNYRANRYNLMGGVTVYGVTFSAAMEQLNGHSPLTNTNGANAFQTPLGTNHAFQGWADKFLTTPGAGIRDVFATVSTQVFGVNAAFVYHSFKDDTGNVNYGDEYDFLATKKFGQHYHVLAKYAYYNADRFSTDTQKVWIEGGISF